ncbi:cysteine-rich RECEPTOR-like kinase [Rhynchospora pubera]|uniref:Cysteine-rich RECEPTOR-like kinase n=1 Tax=Rhynchospora pubera TaxID=906938 RepID=A0AAV8HDE9_9POAL|nr:cysteine-rich RECEPTOR-like kinase [Rhynchospora pubera]
MHLSIFLPLLSLLLVLLPATSDSFNSYICDSTNTPTGNYTANSTYLSNLNTLLSNLKANSTSTGFAAGTLGTTPDKVIGLILCRGDLNASTCSSCFSQIFTDILSTCPLYKTAIMWYDNCYVQFSNQDFLSLLDNLPLVPFVNTKNLTVDQTRFFQDVSQLMSQMVSVAINNSTKYFATGEVKNFSTELSSIYALLQCTTNMAKSQCQSCLQSLINDLPGDSEGKDGAWLVGIYCNIRYDTTPFYNGAAMLQIDNASLSPSLSPISPPGVNDGKKKKNNTAAILAITISLVVAILSSTTFCICLHKKKQRKREKLISEMINPGHNKENIDSFHIGLTTLRAATLNFNESNKLGEGGFGAVYKGILPSGEEVAVKRLSQCSSQGLGELRNELVLVAKLKHKNLVRVVGVCLEDQEKLLVYEFLSNRSLDTFLFDKEKRQELDWTRRRLIINGVARGLQYLHEDSQLKIIHRDLKASNILLDADMNPKISDFGLARLFPVDQTINVTRRIVGTYGYMAPEYAMHGRYSIKSDVFSFGVLLLEVIAGKRNGGSYDNDMGEDLLSSTWDHWTSGTITDIIDSMIDGPLNEIIQYIHIGLLCVQEDLKDRPRMSDVAIMLDGSTISHQAPSKPAFYLRRGGGVSGYGSLNNMVPASRNELTVSEFKPR